MEKAKKTLIGKKIKQLKTIQVLKRDDVATILMKCVKLLFKTKQNKTQYVWH